MHTHSSDDEFSSSCNAVRALVIAFKHSVVRVCGRSSGAGSGAAAVAAAMIRGLIIGRRRRQLGLSLSADQCRADTHLTLDNATLRGARVVNESKNEEHD